MPYTLAHPAAIVPLHRLLRRHTSLSALVIGSMTPDFPFFVGGVSGSFSHSLPGFFLYCMPAGLAAYLLFHLLLKRPSTALLPRMFASRLPPAARALPQVPWAVVATSLAIGVLTHLLWDGFTHPDTVIVEHVAALNAVVGVLGGYEVRLFEALQYGCSFLGLGVLAIALWQWARGAPPGAGDEPCVLPLRARAALFVLMVLGGLGACLAGGLREIQASEAFLVAVIVNAMKGSGLVWIVYCLAWHASYGRPPWRAALMQR